MAQMKRGCNCLVIMLSASCCLVGQRSLDRERTMSALRSSTSVFAVQRDQQSVESLVEQTC